MSSEIKSRESFLKRKLRAERKLTAELTEALEQAVGAATDLETERDQLAGDAQRSAVRAAFDQAAAKANIDPKHVGDLWKLADLDPKKGEPDEAELGRVIRKLAKDRPHVVKAASGDDDEESAEGDEGDGEAADQGDDDEGDGASTGASKPAAVGKPLTKPATATRPLSKGEGAARGARADLKPVTLSDRVDEDFSATGRTDAFRI